MTNWIYRDTKLRGILNRNNDPDNEEESVQNTLKELVPHLKNTSCYKDLDLNIIKSLKRSKTFYGFNHCLNQIYDYADFRKIFIDF
jgi:hypothetical protein